MKHLELYEEYKQKLFWVINWRELSDRVYGLNPEGDEEWDIDYMSRTWESFTQKEIEDIKNLVINKGYGFEVRDLSHDYPKLNDVYLAHLRIFYGKDPSDEIVITKIKDEWYYVSDERSEYDWKCDQFDGLMNCLKYVLDI